MKSFHLSSISNICWESSSKFILGYILGLNILVTSGCKLDTCGDKQYVSIDMEEIHTQLHISKSAIRKLTQNEYFQVKKSATNSGNGPVEYFWLHIGNIILFSNIVLHELDLYVCEVLDKEFSKGKHKKTQGK